MTSEDGYRDTVAYVKGGLNSVINGIAEGRYRDFGDIEHSLRELRTYLEDPSKVLRELAAMNALRPTPFAERLKRATRTEPDFRAADNWYDYSVGVEEQVRCHGCHMPMWPEENASCGEGEMYCDACMAEIYQDDEADRALVNEMMYA